jgi:hypothetical protein
MPESGIGKLPVVYTATVPFAGELLEVGNINGTNFLITYIVVADVNDTVRVSAMEPAVLNITEISENHISMHYGAVEKTTDAYSPNPMIIGRGETLHGPTMTFFHTLLPLAHLKILEPRSWAKSLIQALSGLDRHLRTHLIREETTSTFVNFILIW